MIKSNESNNIELNSSNQTIDDVNSDSLAKKALTWWGGFS